MNLPKRGQLLVMVLLIGVFFLPVLIKGPLASAAKRIQEIPVLKTRSLPLRPDNFGDVNQQFEPYYAFARRSISQAALPLWNPHQGLGTPYIANMQSAFFYPPNLFAYLFPRHGLLLLYASKLLLCAIFMLLWLRSQGISGFAALFGATAFTFGGMNVPFLYWPIASTTFLLPASFFFIDTSFRQSKRIWPYLGLGGCIAIAFFGGQPQMLVYYATAAAAYFVFSAVRTRPPAAVLGRTIFGLAAAALLGLAIAAIQLFPFVEYLKHSDATNRLSAELGARDTLKLFHAALLAVPDLFGNFGLCGMYFSPFRNYNETVTGYAGLSCLVLAIVAFLSYRDDARIRFFTLSSFLLAGVSYGVPLLADVFSRIPLLGTSHLNRLPMVCAFLNATAASFAIARFQQNTIPLNRTSVARQFRLILLAIGVVTLVSILASWPHLIEPRVYLKYLPILAAITAVNVAALLAVLRLPARFVAAGLFLLVAIETAVHGGFYQSATRPRDFYPESDTVKQLREAAGLHRIIGTSRASALPPELATYYRLYDVDSYDCLLVRDTVDALRAYNKIPRGAKRIGQLAHLPGDYLDVIGVEFLITDSLNAAASFLDTPTVPTNFVEFARGAGFTILRNTTVLPRAFAFPASAEVPTELPVARLRQTPVKPVEIVSYLPNRIHIRATADEPSWLYLSDAMYPGWTALVNGSNTTIQAHRATNGRLVRLSPGHNEIEFSYKPRSVYLGAGVSGFGLFVLAIGCLAEFTRRRGKTPRPFQDKTFRQ